MNFETWAGCMSVMNAAAYLLDGSCRWVLLCFRVALQVIRYMEDKLRQRDAMAEKLRLKNTTLKGQLQKVLPKRFDTRCCATKFDTPNSKMSLVESCPRLSTTLCAGRRGNATRICLRMSLNGVLLLRLRLRGPVPIEQPH